MAWIKKTFLFQFKSFPVPGSLSQGMSGYYVQKSMSVKPYAWFPCGLCPLEFLPPPTLLNCPVSSPSHYRDHCLRCKAQGLLQGCKRQPPLGNRSFSWALGVIDWSRCTRITPSQKRFPNCKHDWERKTFYKVKPSMMQTKSSCP